MLSSYFAFPGFPSRREHIFKVGYQILERSEKPEVYSTFHLKGDPHQSKRVIKHQIVTVLHRQKKSYCTVLLYTVVSTGSTVLVLHYNISISPARLNPRRRSRAIYKNRAKPRRFGLVRRRRLRGGAAHPVPPRLPSRLRGGAPLQSGQLRLPVREPRGLRRAVSGSGAAEA